MEFEPKSPLEVADDHLPRIFMEKLSSASDKSKEGIQTTIFRVPDNIRTTNVGYFEPKIVSIGPYHYGNYRFGAMGERIKLSYASNFFGHGDKNMDLLQCIFEQFKRLESNSRCAYSEQIDMASNEFVEMMMLDCAFMASFLKEQAGFIKLENLWTWAVPSIVKDMLIVENQIPLFLLLDFLQIVQPLDDFLRYRLTELFQDIMLRIHQQLSPTSNSISFPGALIEGRAHLLHIFHSMLVSKLRQKTIYDLRTVDLPSFPSAEMLLATRIQFANKPGGSSFLDISFDKSKRIMEIPQLVINEDNISLLRNLIAFEQQCHGVDKYISAYVWFMDCLINTNKDVAVLRQRGIIVSRLHSDGEVAQIFNELRRMDVPVVDIDHLYLAEEIANVKSHCRNRYPSLWPEVIRNRYREVIEEMEYDSYHGLLWHIGKLDRLVWKLESQDFPVLDNYRIWALVRSLPENLGNQTRQVWGLRERRITYTELCTELLQYVEVEEDPEEDPPEDEESQYVKSEKDSAFQL